MQRVVGRRGFLVARASAGVFACLLAVMAAGCGAKKEAPPSIADLQVLALPLDVREVQLAGAEGSRGIFLRLTRFPEGVSHRAMDGPPRLVVDIKGPTGTQGEEDLPGKDDLVSRLRVQRDFGVLRILVDLQGDHVPEYSVHPMADWIMIRFKAPRRG